MGSLRAIAVVLILVPAVAFAQPTAAEKQKASELVKKAIAKSQAGDHDAAVDLYQEAYKIVPQPLLLSNIGSELQQMKKPVEARTYFCRYIEADPNGANVSYATAQAKSLYLELSGATSVDDKDVCKPIVKSAPPPDPIPNEPSAPAEPVDAPKPKASPLRYVGIAVAVLGAGAFGGGIYFGMEAKKISDEITNHPIDQPWPGDIKEREAQGASHEKKQIGLMIGGGIAIAAGVTMIFVGGPKSSSETSVSIAPVATGDTLGFAAAGRF